MPTTGYLALPDAVPPTFTSSTGAELWSVDVQYDWQQGGPGTYAVVGQRRRSPTDVAVIGSGSVDLQPDVRTCGDTDVEVTISEVRPDGRELYVQSGWLRASQRALDRGVDRAPAGADPPRGRRRAAPRRRVRVGACRDVAVRARLPGRLADPADPSTAPGGNRAVWEFETIAGGEQVTIAHDAAHPSRLVLPVVAGVIAPESLPDCDALRGQPCRPAP